MLILIPHIGMSSFFIEPCSRYLKGMFTECVVDAFFPALEKRQPELHSETLSLNKQTNKNLGRRQVILINDTCLSFHRLYIPV